MTDAAAEIHAAREIIAGFLLWHDPAYKPSPSESLEKLVDEAKRFMGKGTMTDTYRIRYSRITSGLKVSKQTYAIEFQAASPDEMCSTASEKWSEVVARKYTGLDFIDLVKVIDWKP